MQVESALHGCSQALDRGDASFHYVSIILVSRTLHLIGAISTTATFVPPKRLFSSAGSIYTDHRNRILVAEQTENLLFFKSNYSMNSA